MRGEDEDEEGCPLVFPSLPSPLPVSVHHHTSGPSPLLLPPPPSSTPGDVPATAALPLPRPSPLPHLASRIKLAKVREAIPTRVVARLKSIQNSGAFPELFWVLMTKTEKFCGILKNNGSFSGAFLGAFDKYVEILCYFGSFSKVLVAFGSFLERF